VTDKLTTVSLIATMYLTCPEWRRRLCTLVSRRLRSGSCWCICYQPVHQRSATGHSRPALSPSCTNRLTLSSGQTTDKCRLM